MYLAEQILVQVVWVLTTENVTVILVTVKGVTEKIKETKWIRLKNT